MPPKLNFSDFPKLVINSNDVAGSWRTFIRRFDLEIEIKRRESGKHAVDGVQVDVFDEESKLLALLKAIDLEGGDILSTEGLAWGDGRITYELALQALKNHYAREESVFVRTQKFVTMRQLLGEDHRDYIQRIERLGRTLACFNNADEGTHAVLQVAREAMTLSLTINGLRDQALKVELMAKENLTWPQLKDILRTRTVAAESNEKLTAVVNTQNRPLMPVVKREPSDVCRVYEGSKQSYVNRSRENSRERSVGFERRPNGRETYRENHPKNFASDRDQYRPSHQRSPKFSRRPREQNRMCFQCGREDHHVRNCPEIQCYKCREYGHMASLCKKAMGSPKRYDSQSRARSPSPSPGRGRSEIPTNFIREVSRD